MYSIYLTCTSRSSYNLLWIPPDSSAMLSTTNREWINCRTERYRAAPTHSANQVRQSRPRVVLYSLSSMLHARSTL